MSIEHLKSEETHNKLLNHKYCINLKQQTMSSVSVNILRQIGSKFFLLCVGIYGYEMLLVNISFGSLFIIMCAYLVLFELPIAWISIQSHSIFADNYSTCSMIRYLHTFYPKYCCNDYY